MEAEMKLSLQQRDKEIKDLENAMFLLEGKPQPQMRSFRAASPINAGQREESSGEYDHSPDLREASIRSVPKRPMFLHTRSSSQEGRRSLSRLSSSSRSKPKISALVSSIRSRLPVSGRSSAMSRTSEPLA